METKELFRMKSNYREDMLVQGIYVSGAPYPLLQLCGAGSGAFPE